MNLPVLSVGQNVVKLWLKYYALVLNWQEIYRRGGRKFAFINLPDLGCLPGIRIIKSENNESCLEEATSLATLHNQALSKLLFELEKRLKGFKYSLFDFNRNLRQRMHHPSKYGTYKQHPNYKHFSWWTWS